MTIATLIPAIAEIWLAVAGLGLLMIGAFRGDKSTRLVVALTAVAFAVALLLVVAPRPHTTVVLNGLFITDPFAVFMKALVLIGAGLTLILGLGFIRREKMERIEYPVLLLFATLGMMMMISANDLISLYMGLELQSLALYVVAAFQRDSLRSTEAGLKYFVLGSLASGMLLYGCSLVYGFTGTTRFEALAALFADSGQAPAGVIVGLVFIAAGLAFKVSAAPFHMWTPDVYEGAPSPVSAFFSVAPKIAAMALFMRVMMQPFGALADQWQQIIVFISVASMLLGAFAALPQNNIKRLLAYSSIGHVGYVLLGLAAGTVAGIRGIVLYLAIYLAMSVGVWGCVLAMRRQGRMVEGINDLAGLSRSNPRLAMAMGIFMFAMAGIPPFAGFFGKFYIFLAVIDAEMYGLAVIGVLSSVVAAYYYLRIVKVMYFDEAADPFDSPMGREISVIVGATALFVLFFFAYPAPLLRGAQAAASALFP
ncbi:MAG: NADH-quinone oxidoreductase subunit NuoN [Proteobacteria bacterium]|nr:NADH-quinone oxidoreductase subunit NuoN [Pseudomonadota bacterium]